MRSEKSVRIVLDEEKILREGKYKLDELYAYLDDIAQKAKLKKRDKYTYVADRDENDMARLGIFTISEAIENEAITRNAKEWYWLKDGVIIDDIIKSAKTEGDGIWE